MRPAVSPGQARPRAPRGTGRGSAAVSSLPRRSLGVRRGEDPEELGSVMLWGAPWARAVRRHEQLGADSLLI